MCRRRSSLDVIAAAIAACLTVSLAAQHAGNDWVGAYLERHGLSQLLAVHLEELLEETTDTNEREALQVRLVGLYAQLVDETDDPTLRAVLEERSIRLLATASEEAGFELKIALLRARYRTTEKVAVWPSVTVTSVGCKVKVGGTGGSLTAMAMPVVADSPRSSTTVTVAL